MGSSSNPGEFLCWHHNKNRTEAPGEPLARLGMSAKVYTEVYSAPFGLSF